MILQQILQHETIHIQCHNDPDADAIAAGYALYCYCKDAGKNVRLFYSGGNSITKPNIIKMLEGLDIPLEYIPSVSSVTGLLVLVDCQYGERNVSAPVADTVYVIDHHIQRGIPSGAYDIRPYLAACATLVWSLLTEAGYGMSQQVLTALHYGLYMDSQGFDELGHPLDRDLRDQPALNNELLRILKNSNLSLEDLHLASSSLKKFQYYPNGRYMVVGAPHCDPNILGFISDLAMQVDKVDVVLAYSDGPNEIKYSIRSISRESKASHLAEYISEGIGSGGGHAGKAGGRFDKQKFQQVTSSVSEFFDKKLSDFLDVFECVDCNALGKVKEAYQIRASIPLINFGEMREYEKQPEHLAFVRCAEHFSIGSKLHIRMLEGDISLALQKDTFLMVGGSGEVYPINEKDFLSRYTPISRPISLELPYSPVILDANRGERHLVTTLASSCLTKAEVKAYAAPLKKGIRLFTKWDKHNYVKGIAGDWLVVNQNTEDDWYIVTKKRFPLIYKRD